MPYILVLISNTTHHHTMVTLHTAHCMCYMLTSLLTYSLISHYPLLTNYAIYSGPHLKYYSPSQYGNTTHCLFMSYMSSSLLTYSQISHYPLLNNYAIYSGPHLKYYSPSHHGNTTHCPLYVLYLNQPSHLLTHITLPTAY